MLISVPMLYLCVCVDVCVIQCELMFGCDGVSPSVPLAPFIPLFMQTRTIGLCDSLTSNLHTPNSLSLTSELPWYGLS